MPDLQQQVDELKMMPDQVLQRELIEPSGAVPGYLVLAEAQRRQLMRQAAEQQMIQGQSKSSVYDDVVRSMMARQPPQGVAPAGMTPIPNQPAQGMGSTPPQNFQAPPMAMAEGGEVDEDDDAGDYYDTSADTGLGSAFTEDDEVPSEGYAERSATQRVDLPALRDAMIIQEGTQDPKSLGYRNNNPGNLKFDNQAGATLGDNGFARFSDGQAGQDAMDDQIRRNVARGLTLREMIGGKKGVYKGWAPASDNNDPQTYAANVAASYRKQTGDDIDPDLPLEAGAAGPKPFTPPAGPAPPPQPTLPSGPTLPLPTTDTSGLASAIMSAPGEVPAAPPPDELLSPETIGKIRQQVESYTPAYDYSAERQRVQQLRDYYEKAAEHPNPWQMLADFGWGLAASRGPSWIMQVGQAGQNMAKMEDARQQQARQGMLAALGVDVNLDNQARQYQDKIGELTNTAVDQAYQRKLMQVHYQQLEQQTAAQAAATAAYHDQQNQAKAVENVLRGKTGVQRQLATATVPAGFGSIADPASPGYVYIYSLTPQPTKLPSKDEQLFTGAAQSVGARYGLANVKAYSDLPEMYQLPKDITLGEPVMKPDGTMTPAGTILKAGTTVYPRQEAETRANQGAIEKSGQTAVNKLLDTTEGRTQMAANMKMDPQAADYFIKTGKFLSTSMEPTAQAVANYQIPLAQAVSRLPPADRQALTARIMEINPQFIEGNYNNYVRADGNFRYGKNADRIADMNSAMGHMGVLYDAAQSVLQNTPTSIKMLNQIATNFKAAIGATPQETFASIVHAVGPELARVYISGAGGERDREKIESDFNENKPQQALLNIAARAKLLGTVMNSSVHEYLGGTYGRGSAHANFFTPEAIAALNKVAPGTVHTATRDQIQQYANQYYGGNFEQAHKAFADRGVYLQ